MPGRRRTSTDARPSPPVSSDEVRRAWEGNAAFWDERMGEGNPTHLRLVLPATERLLAVRPGERLLEIACGNGQLARWLAARGATVVATDFSEAMLERARRRRDGPGPPIEYRPLDATDPAALRSLGAGRFSAVVCSMALMDMSTVEPLAAALPELLEEDGRFVFSVTHPSFNSSGARRVREEEDDGGTIRERRGVFVSRYATPAVAKGLAMIGQPVPQFYFDRPLSELLRPFFDAGMALDALEEPTFAPGDAPGRAMGWSELPEIPPVLVGRLRPVVPHGPARQATSAERLGGRSPSQPAPGRRRG